MVIVDSVVLPDKQQEFVFHYFLEILRDKLILKCKETFDQK